MRLVKRRVPRRSGTPRCPLLQRVVLRRPVLRDVLLLFLQLALGPSNLVVVTRESRATPTRRRGARRAREVPVLRKRDHWRPSPTGGRSSVAGDSRTRVRRNGRYVLKSRGKPSGTSSFRSSESEASMVSPSDVFSLVSPYSARFTFAASDRSGKSRGVTGGSLGSGVQAHLAREVFFGPRAVHETQVPGGAREELTWPVTSPASPATKPSIPGTSSNQGAAIQFVRP